MFAQLQVGSVDRVLIPNYFDILRLTDSEPAMKLFSVVDVINEPFLTGMASVNKQGSDNKAFVSCLQKKIKSFRVVWNTNFANEKLYIKLV
jgi:cobalamin-dependent methionine synthase I